MAEKSPLPSYPTARRLFPADHRAAFATLNHRVLVPLTGDSGGGQPQLEVEPSDELFLSTESPPIVGRTVKQPAPPIIALLPRALSFSAIFSLATAAGTVLPGLALTARRVARCPRAGWRSTQASCSSTARARRRPASRTASREPRLAVRPRLGCTAPSLVSVARRGVCVSLFSRGRWSGVARALSAAVSPSAVSGVGSGGRGGLVLTSDRCVSVRDQTQYERRARLHVWERRRSPRTKDAS